MTLVGHWMCSAVTGSPFLREPHCAWQFPYYLLHLLLCLPFPCTVAVEQFWFPGLAMGGWDTYYLATFWEYYNSYATHSVHWNIPGTSHTYALVPLLPADTFADISEPGWRPIP